VLVVFVEDWLIGALELYCPRLMILIMCVGLKMFLVLWVGGRGEEGKEGLGVIRRVGKERLEIL
jgi:hypothetical protein